MIKRRGRARGCALRARGFSLIEALVALVVLLVLLFVVGDAVSRTLHVAAMSNARAGSMRTVSELGTRLSEEARSSSAVFIPANDVFGVANTGDQTHEVDFFRRLSAGGDTYVAYRYDASSGVVNRFEYSLAAGVVSIVHTDQAAAGIAVFSALRSPAGSMGDIVDAADVSDVSIRYGTVGVVGGNDVVTVTMQAAPSGGVTPDPVLVRLVSRVAPTSLSVLVPALPPPPPANGGPITIPFVIRNAGHGFHGVWHFGDPGGSEFSGVHENEVFGQVEYYGPGQDGGVLDWLGLTAADPIVQSGSYIFTDISGAEIMLTITCDDGAPCPRFRPLPISGGPPTPPGGVEFDASP